MTRSQRVFVAVVAAALLVLAVLGRAAISGRADERNYELFPDMLASVPYDAFAPCPVFADGKTLRPPVPGTVARGALPLRYEATPEGARRAGEELANPFQDTPAVLERGHAAFTSFCSHCHGASGRGDGPVAKRGFPPPAALASAKVRAMKDGQLLHVITFGQGNMPPHAAQVALEDRWKIIRYVRTLKEQP